jgi:hypothetical protein
MVTMFSWLHVALSASRAISPLEQAPRWQRANAASFREKEKPRPELLRPFLQLAFGLANGFPTRWLVLFQSSSAYLFTCLSAIHFSTASFVKTVLAGDLENRNSTLVEQFVDRASMNP